jgi:hypothetical protein
MSVTFTNERNMGFLSTEPVPGFLRVKLVGHKIALCGDEEAAIGTCINGPIGEDVGGLVKLVNSDGNHIVVAAEPITAGSPIYAAAGGRVKASGSIPRGYAIDDASGAGELLGALLYS